ncbi:MAG: hypothetical protein ACRDGN_05150 [bacterium]
MREVQLGTARGPGEPIEVLRIAGFDVSLTGTDVGVARDAALKLGASLQQLADRAVGAASTASHARRQFMTFCRAVVG